MRNIFSAIAVILLSWLLFVSSHFLIDLIDYFLLELLDAPSKFYHTLTIDKVEQYYPNYPNLVYTLFLFAYWSKLLWLPLCLLMVFGLHKLFAFPRIWHFKIMTICLVLFFLEGALELFPEEKVFQSEIVGIDLKKMQYYYADSLGINKYVQNSKNLPPGYHINEQGFRSQYPFSQKVVDSLKQTSTVVMFIGDSYVEGCCAKPIDSSFVNLIDNHTNYTALNFGVGGTDLKQYELIAKEYIPELLPDVVITVLTKGDCMEYDRKPKPYQPMYYQTNYGFLETHLPPTHPAYSPGSYFKDWQEAKMFYLKHYTLAGVKKSWLETFILGSNVNNLLYFMPTLIQNKIIYNRHVNEYNNRFNQSIDKTKRITQKHLSNIQDICQSNDIPFVLIRAPTIKHTNLTRKSALSKYKKKTGNIKLHYPGTFEREDFISHQNDHFNNRGHRKFAKFLLQKLNE